MNYCYHKIVLNLRINYLHLRGRLFRPFQNPQMLESNLYRAQCRTELFTQLLHQQDGLKCPLSPNLIAMMFLR